MLQELCMGLQAGQKTVQLQILNNCMKSEVSVTLINASNSTQQKQASWQSQLT